MPRLRNMPSPQILSSVLLRRDNKVKVKIGLPPFFPFSAPRNPKKHRAGREEEGERQYTCATGQEMREITMYLLLCSIAAAAPTPKEREFTNSIGMRLVRIEPGDFTMG